MTINRTYLILKLTVQLEIMLSSKTINLKLHKSILKKKSTMKMMKKKNKKKKYNMKNNLRLMNLNKPFQKN